MQLKFLLRSLLGYRGTVLFVLSHFGSPRRNCVVLNPTSRSRDDLPWACSIVKS